MHRLTVAVLAIAGAFVLQASSPTKIPDGRSFPTAEAAARALVGAAKNNDVPAIVEILGPSAKDIVSTRDSIADRKVRRNFTARAGEKMKLIDNHGRTNEKMLLVGNDEWPLPIPIIKRNGRWYFDSAQGRQEILNRRIGSNELDAIEVCRGYVEAENQYGEAHQTEAGFPTYAQKVISTPGEQDGLYWPGNEDTPIGQIIARAFAEGYINKHDPYHGYYFKVLTGQGPHASGGEMSYLEDGAMTKGFAMIAWPANYGSTGIMTFVVNRTGIVYQKDLGRNTASIVAAYTSFNPDRTWTPVSDSPHPVISEATPVR